MKLGQVHRYGEWHALRGGFGWWLIGLLGFGRPVCHMRGRHTIGVFAGGEELATCSWCRQKLGLMTYRKGTPPPGEPATFEGAVHEGLLAGTLPKPSNDFPGYTPSILFAEPKEE